MGFPTRREPHGNGASIVVSGKESLLQGEGKQDIHKCVKGRKGEMLHSSKYLSIVAERSRQGKNLERVYRNFRNVDLLKMAYMNLYANKGATTAGTNPQDAIDGMNLQRIQKLSDDLREGRFEWTPVRRVYIPKANGKSRPLGIPNWSDKMVQEAMRLVLQAYYEPRFSEYSFGFRQGKGCHEALEHIRKHWTGTTWFIEGDIKGCFDRINHEVLLGILEKDIRDERFIKLVRTMLQAGYMEKHDYTKTYSGTPQGGICSPILANIYLNELDKFVNEVLIPKYHTHKEEYRGKINPEYKKWLNRARYLEREIEKKVRMGGDKEAIDLMKQVYKQTKREMRKYPLADPFDLNTRRLRYVRYADDFILGYTGPKAEAEKIKQELTEFIKSRLRLDLSQEKTLITHAAQGQASFLGYNISIQKNNEKLTKGSNGAVRRSVNGRIALRMPKAVVTKWVRKYAENGQGQPRPELLRRSDFDILSTYKSELTGIYEYYKLAANVYRLHAVQGVMWESLTQTLAHKHKMSCKAVIKKYIDRNKELRVTVEREGKTPLSVAFGRTPMKRYRGVSSSTKDRNYIVQIYAGRSELLQRIQADECELCGSKENIEAHHINSIKKLKQRWEGRKNKPGWVEKMSALNRKTLVVCKKCHTDIHAGRYDGKRLAKGRKTTK